MPESDPGADIRKVLLGEHKGLSRFRKSFRKVPADPRCKLCLAPFGGAPGAVLRHFGFGRFPGNPAMCTNCIRQYSKHGAIGAEIPISLLFADVRGSTGIGERLSPTEFRAFLTHFYEIGSKAILGHDGLVDKLVGDEIIGLFFGGVSGPHHAAAAIAAGRELIDRVGRADATPSGPIPLGGGVHTGVAYVGPTGPIGAVDDFTALGDVVNTTARLASAAAAGELLVSRDAAREAVAPTAGLEQRTLEVRGREATIDVLVVRAAG
ncbi:MAG: adenylate/guanylate cyclase domain-containing protein [Chloroflexota bacterium]|jgi:adenylate cyclase